MKLASFEHRNQHRIGVLEGERIVVLPTGLTMKMLVQRGVEWIDQMIVVATETISAVSKSGVPQSIQFLPPIVNPTKVIALGRNYAAHAKEGGAQPPKYPMLFHKTATSLIGHQQNIIIPPITKKVDYEGELAVIIGRTCYQVTPDEALDYVAGYTCANDVSARDLQRRTSQFTAGKMLDTFGPLGPYLVTADEIPDPHNLNIETRLNGKVMQASNTRKMIFDVPFTISYISQITTLEVGDVILTGTPEGVGYARTPPVYLQAGDEVAIMIEKVGTLVNQVAAM